MNDRQHFDFSQLRKNAHIHLMGICGTAMGSLAGILKEMGYRVTGSDENVYPPMSTQLADLGIEVMKGYRKENLEPKPDLVVVGNVIRKVYEEPQALLASDIPYTSLPKAMGEFVIADKKSIVVAGTHGKTTTTSMMAWINEKCGFKPGFLIGGIPKNFSRSFQVPEGDVFVIEGDEYDTAFFDKVPKFIHYKPKYVILTGVEFDHADIYKNMDDVSAAFKRLVELIPGDGILVINEESPEAMKLAPLCKGRVVTFGLNRGQYHAESLEKKDGRTCFQVIRQGRAADSLDIGVFGDYNIANALAAYALSAEMGYDTKNVKSAISSFSGVKRRQEIIGQPNDITVIEDFAHHPTAVRMTIEAIQSHYPGRKVFSVFEPRSATSRRKIFEQDYIEALSLGSPVILAKPYNQTLIDENDRLSGERIIEELKKRGREAYLIDGAEHIVSLLAEQARPGDVILIMSNGGFDGLYGKLLSRLAGR